MHEDVYVVHDTSQLPAAIDDLHEVMMSLTGLTVKWQRLGLALGLLYPTLEIIETDNRDIDMRKKKMMAAWLHRQDHVRRKGIPSWLVLVAALREIGENELADNIIVSRSLICLCARKSIVLLFDLETEGSKRGGGRETEGHERGGGEGETEGSEGGGGGGK